MPIVLLSQPDGSDVRFDLPVAWPPVLRHSPDWPPELVIDPETANGVYGAEIYTHQGNGRYLAVVNCMDEVASRCDEGHLPEAIAWGNSTWSVDVHAVRFDIAGADNRRAYADPATDQPHAGSHASHCRICSRPRIPSRLGTQ